MDIYTEHHPHHEIGPIEHLKYVGAQYYTTLLSRLTSHIKNEDVHVSNEDRYKWDNKADKTALRELEIKMAELTPSSDKDDIDLSTYATHTWVDENFARKGYYPTYEDLSSRYALKTDIPSVTNFATKVYVDNAIANIKPGSSSDMSGYATKQDVKTLDDFVESAVNGLQDQINNIDQFTLSPASDKKLGGFKTGYQGTGNNYAVKMNGEYAYVSIPFSTTGGDDLVVTSLYNIEVVSNTLKLQNNVLSGSISWRISEAQGSSYSYIAPGTENIYTAATILPNNRSLQSPPNTEDGTYVGYAPNIQIDVADYVSITVEKSGVVVARQVIPIQNPGSNGKDGTTTVEYQNLEYPVIRLRGEYKEGTHYNSGDESENGVYYIDIVSYEGGLYKALVSGNNAAPTSTNNQWEPFSIYGQSAFYNLLVANQAFITALASKQIVVVNNEGKPVAGLLSNDANVTTEAGTFQRSGVRIFAGETNGNIAAAPFRVYDDGSVVIEKGSFTSTNGGATAQLSLYGHQSNVQPHLYLENSVGQTAEMTALNLTFRQAGNTTSIAASGIHTPYIEAAQGSFSNKLDVNGTLNVIGDLLLNGNPIGGSSEGITIWVEITGSDAYYTFKIEKGSLTGVYRNTDSESLAAVGDMILWLNIQNGNSRAYRKTANGQGVAW